MKTGPKADTCLKLHQHRRRRRQVVVFSEIRLPDRTQTLVVTGGAVAFLVALALSVLLSHGSYQQAVAQGSNYTGQSQTSPATEAHRAVMHPPATPVPAPYAGYRVAVPALLTPDPAERVVLPVDDEM
ncbi:hypothetical protein MTO96_024462 [Rhipicephalus appendiculatus]